MARTIDWNERPVRSLLFAPGNHPRRLQQVGRVRRGRDRPRPRGRGRRRREGRPRAGQRARRSPTYDDNRRLRARQRRARRAASRTTSTRSSPRTLDAIMVPKIETPTTLRAGRRAASPSAEREPASRRARSACSRLVETAQGPRPLRADLRAARPSGVVTVVFGLGDFSVDIGVDLTLDATELALRALARSSSPRAPPGSRRRSTVPSCGSRTSRASSPTRLRSRAARLPGPRRRLPAAGRARCSARTPTLPRRRLERQRRVVEAFEEAESPGLASIQVDGRFVDYPIYYRAKAPAAAATTPGAARMSERRQEPAARSRACSVVDCRDACSPAP